MLSGIQQNKLDRIRQAIRAELLKCNQSATPILCNKVSTKKGYAEVEELVLKRCIAHRLTPAEIVGELESELAE